MKPERLQIRSLGCQSCEGLGHQDRTAQGAGQGLDATDLVHRASDHGEIQPVGGADVAEDHVTDVQANPDRQVGLAF